MSALLEVKGLEAGYGRSQVLFGIDLEVQPGQCATLLGRNGMGKTTTLKSILGLIVPMRGELLWKGQSLAGRAPHQIARLGIGLVPEGRQVFPNLTVRENLVATAALRRATAHPWTLERVHALFPRLAERGRNFGNQLSGGEQQMLAIGRALMTNPELLILDEATEGLSPLIRNEIWNALAQIQSEGTAILIVDKNLVPLLKLANRHHVVEKGKVVWAGNSEALRGDKSALQRYLSVDGHGAQAPATAPAAPMPDEQATGPTLLDSLYREHRTITAVLDTFSHMLRGMAEDGRDFDARPLHAILHYLDLFPEQHHHPKEEDFLFPAIRARTGEADAILERLSQQHRRGTQALQELQAELGRAEQGQAEQRRSFGSLARTFVDRYREHLRVEEDELMPIARRALSAAEWAVIEEKFSQRPDPLVLDGHGQGGDMLVRRILELLPAPLGYAPATAPQRT